MKKIIAISFFSCFLFANTELGQLLKLPQLIHHYYEHEEHDKDKSLMTFLREHYGTEKSSNSDSKEHQKLPFKALHTDISQGHIFFSPVFTLEYKLERPLIISEKTLFHEQLDFSSAPSSIWQPPRRS